MLIRHTRTVAVVAITATLTAPPAQVAAAQVAAAQVAAPQVAAPQVAAPAMVPAAILPTTLELPDGLQPEGIAIGSLPYAYFGSRRDGSIYRANLIIGRGRTISAGPGTPALGLKIDRRGRLFIAGGSGGDARIVDAATGRVLRSYPLQAPPAFINDVVLTRRGAWFTDSLNPVLFRLPLGRHGMLPAQAERVPLTGDIVYGPGNNANGISTTPDGQALLIIQSNTGKLFRVSTSGHTTEVDLGGDVLTNGDGMLRQGRTLFVVQNRLNTVAKLRLDAAGTRAVVVARVTDPRFDIPTTVAAYGHRLYLPNARFSTPPTLETEYTAVAIRRP